MFSISHFLVVRKSFFVFFNEDLSAIIIGVNIKIAISTPKENSEQINKAKDVLIFQNKKSMLTSLVF